MDARCRQRRVALIVLITSMALVLVAQVLAGVRPQASSVLSQKGSRRYPVVTDWVIPEGYTEIFRADAADGKRKVQFAEWHVDGAEQDRKRRAVQRTGEIVSSKYSFKAHRAGVYTVTCTFLAEDGNRPFASWSVRVDTAATSAHGRVKYPVDSKPGAMLFVKGGTFLMGALSEKSYRLGDARDAMPAHEVHVADFYIGKYPVTAGEFCEFLNERGNPGRRYLDMYMVQSIGMTANLLYDPESEPNYRLRGDLASCPVTQVTWFGAAEYCRWLSERTGNKFGIPDSVR